MHELDCVCQWTPTQLADNGLCYRGEDRIPIETWGEWRITLPAPAGIREKYDAHTLVGRML
jgi:hypothetical protein